MKRRMMRLWIATAVVLVCTMASAPVLAERVEVVTDTWMELRNPSDENEARIVLRFDLPAELAGKRIETAYIDLDLAAGGDAVARVKLEARRLERSWDPGEVVWQDLFQGGEALGGEDAACLAAAGALGTARFEVTDLVRGWVDTPAANYGLVVSTADPGAIVEARVRRIAGATVGPLLRIWYSD